MSIATSTTIQAVTGFNATIGSKIEDHLNEAEIECKRILSTSRTRGEATGTEGADNIRTVLDVERERYDEIVALGSSNKHYIALQRAEALLATYYALPFLNMRLTEEGGLMRAIGLVEGQRDLMSNMEMEAYRRSIYAQVYAILMKLLRVEDASEKIVYTL
jgi:hypothetical protein